MRIDIELDDRDLRAALSEMIQRGQDLTPAMRSIGDALVNSARERFRDEEAPDGTRWAELSDVTKGRRRIAAAMPRLAESVTRAGTSRVQALRLVDGSCLAESGAGCRPRLRHELDSSLA